MHLKTGGTINGCVPEYKEVEDIAKLFHDTVDFDKYLTKSFNIPCEYQEFEVCNKDSRDINEHDRQVIAEVIQREYAGGMRRFLVSHGTYTMPETA